MFLGYSIINGIKNVCLQKEANLMRSFKKSTWIFLAVLVTAIFAAVKYLSEILGFFQVILHVLSPFFTGLVMAYILNLPMRRFEKWYFPRSQNKFLCTTRRPVCLILSVLSILLVLAGVVMLVVPELAASITLLAEEIPPAVKALYEWGIKQVEAVPELQTFIQNINVNLSEVLKNVVGTVASGTGDVINTIVTVLSAIFGTLSDVVIGFIFALFLLAGKERLLSQVHRVVHVLAKPVH